MKDVLFHNFFGKKGHKTASAPCPTETLRGICPSALFRPTALPRGILHLIKFGIRNSCTKQHSPCGIKSKILMRNASWNKKFLHKTTFVARLPEYRQHSWYGSAREFLCRRETEAEIRPRQP